MHELDTGDPGPDDDEVAWQLRRRVGVTGGEYAVAINGCPLRNSGAAPGTQHDDVGVENLVGRAVVGAMQRRYRNAVRPHQTSTPFDDPHTLTLEQSRHGRPQTLLDPGDAGGERLQVKLGCGGAETHGRRGIDQSQRSTGGDHGL